MALNYLLNVSSIFIINFLKTNEQNEIKYKNCKNLFEAIKKRSKNNHFFKLIFSFKNNIEKTWEIIKYSIGKSKCKNQNFPKKFMVDIIAITDETQIAKTQIVKNLIKCFTEVGLKLGK